MQQIYSMTQITFGNKKFFMQLRGCVFMKYLDNGGDLGWLKPKRIFLLTVSGYIIEKSFFKNFFRTAFYCRFNKQVIQLESTDETLVTDVEEYYKKTYIFTQNFL